MSAIFKSAEQYLPSEVTGVFVEIGSDRHEGSTYEFDRLAGIHGSRLITVDILPEAKNRLGHRLTNTDFIIAEGTDWARGYQGPKIACLYLDNFDYIYDTNEVNSMIEEQKEMYSRMGMVMDNQNCQTIHMSQMLSLYPHLEQNAVVMLDDTYKINDCWVGKCGGAVLFLLAQGWRIEKHTTDCGVLMVRG